MTNNTLNPSKNAYPVSAQQYPPAFVHPQPTLAQPVVIEVRDGFTPGATACPSCGHIGPSVQKKRMGTASCAWCWVLFFTTAICWVVPVCCDYCKDTQFRCERCGAVKTVHKGECC